MATPRVNQILMNIAQNKLTQDELRELNRGVVDAIKRNNWTESLQAMSRLHVGQHVKFDSRKRGRVIPGIVTKLNEKTCSVNCGVHGPWKVDAGLLVPITEAEFNKLTGSAGQPTSHGPGFPKW